MTRTPPIYARNDARMLPLLVLLTFALIGLGAAHSLNRGQAAQAAHPVSSESKPAPDPVPPAGVASFE
jgi:hypothetical protein